MAVSSAVAIRAKLFSRNHFSLGSAIMSFPHPIHYSWTGKFWSFVAI
jgi:hypothetical protein